MMVDLASELGTEIGTDGSINYNGKKVNFYSETEMFHVDKKKFKTPEEVINYLDSVSPEESEEPSFEETEGDLAKRDLEDEMEAFESKSYKRTFESYKRKK
jgi:hypothetical protein